MFVILGLLGLSLTFLVFSPAPLVMSVAHELNMSCQSLTPNDAASSLRDALICGMKGSDGARHEALLRSGLLHVLVVSGAHLIFFERILSKLIAVFLPGRPRGHLLGTLLLLFALATGFQPPMARAFCAWCVRRMNDNLSLCFRPSLITGMSAVLCLSFEPHWLMSVSFQLAWSASLILDLTKRRNPLVQASAFFLILLPFLAEWSVPHFSSVVVNATLASLTTVMFLPLGLFELALSGLFESSPFAILWTTYFDAIALFTGPLPLSEHAARFTGAGKLTLVVGLQILCFAKDYSLHRFGVFSSYFSPQSPFQEK